MKSIRSWLVRPAGMCPFHCAIHGTCVPAPVGLPLSPFITRPLIVERSVRLGSFVAGEDDQRALAEFQGVELRSDAPDQLVDVFDHRAEASLPLFTFHRARDVAALPWNCRDFTGEVARCRMIGRLNPWVVRQHQRVVQEERLRSMRSDVESLRSPP